MRGKVGFLISHSANYFGIERKLHEKALEELLGFAEKLQCEVVPYGPIQSGEEAIEARAYFQEQEIDYMIMYIADFSSGDIMMNFEKMFCPIGIWFPAEPYKEGDIQLNAAVTANMFASIAQRKFDKETSCDWYYGDIQDRLVKDKLEVALRVAKAKKNITTATVGILGDVAPTFYNLENNHFSERFPNMKIERLNMQEILEGVEMVTELEFQEAKDLIVHSCNKMEAVEKSINNSAKVYVALKKILEEKKVDCLAAACWPDFQDAFQIVPCVIYTLLGSQLNIPTACEGDIGGALSLLLAKEVSGRVPTLMDLTSMDKETGSLLLWHCGISSTELQPDEGVKIIDHPMLDRKNPNRELMGLAYDYHFIESDVTVLRYSNNDKLFSFECTIEGSDKGYSGTRGYLNNFSYLGNPFLVEDVVDAIFENGIEHHLIVCPGKVGGALFKLADELGIENIEIKKYKAY